MKNVSVVTQKASFANEYWPPHVRSAQNSFFSLYLVFANLVGEIFLVPRLISFWINLFLWFRLFCESQKCKQGIRNCRLGYMDGWQTIVLQCVNALKNLSSQQKASISYKINYILTLKKLRWSGLSMKNSLFSFARNFVQF